jgi:hypothetical protein
MYAGHKPVHTQVRETGSESVLPNLFSYLVDVYVKIQRHGGPANNHMVSHIYCTESISTIAHCRNHKINQLT